MACPNCGIEKNDNANFCWSCGYNFTKETLEEYRDSYQINTNGSIIIGLGSGIVTGIFSAALSQVIKLDLLGWGIVLAFSFLVCGSLIITSLLTMKESATRQIRRRQ